MQAVEEESVSRYVSSYSAHKDVPHAKKIDAITIGIRRHAVMRRYARLCYLRARAESSDLKMVFGSAGLYHSYAN